MQLTVYVRWRCVLIAVAVVSSYVALSCCYSLDSWRHLIMWKTAGHHQNQSKPLWSSRGEAQALGASPRLLFCRDAAVDRSAGLQNWAGHVFLRHVMLSPGIVVVGSVLHWVSLVVFSTEIRLFGKAHDCSHSLIRLSTEYQTEASGCLFSRSTDLRP